jgi:hypothetical protein
MRTPFAFALLVALAVLAAGCPGPKAGGLAGSVRRAQLDQASIDKHAAAVTAGDTAYAARADRAQLEAAIARYAEAVAIKDDDWETYEKLSHAYYLLADGHIYFEGDAKKADLLATYAKGYAAAERGLAAFSPPLEQRLQQKVDLKDAVAVITDVRAVGLMYWYATNLGKWGNSQDITVVLEYKERIFNIMTKVEQLDQNYFHGAPLRYFGAYYAIAPSFAGGDLDKSWAYFQKAIAHEPKYLATYNLIAENLAPKRQDEKMFDDMIAKVNAAPLDAIPGLEAEAAIEKKKAEQLAKRRAGGEFF